MMSTGFAPGKPAADLTARDLMWLNEHPKEARIALDAYAKAEDQRAGIIAAAEKQLALAKEQLATAETMAREKREAAEAEAAKIVGDATAEAAALTKAAADAKAESESRLTIAKAASDVADKVTAEQAATGADIAKRVKAVIAGEERLAARDADLQRRIAIVDAAHAEARSLAG